MEGGGLAAGLAHEVCGAGEVLLGAEEADEGEGVPRAAVVRHGTVHVALALQVLGPPPYQATVTGPVHVALQHGELAHLGEHAWDLLAVGACHLVVLHRPLHVADRLQEGSVRKVGARLVHLVLCPRHVQRALPLSGGAEQLVQLVKAAGTAKQVGGVVQQAQLHRHRGDPHLGLLIRRLAQGARTPRVPHVGQAHLGHVQAA